MSLAGSLTEFDLPEVLSLLSLASGTGTLLIRVPSGELHLGVDGDDLVGDDAVSLVDDLHAILGASEGSFEWRPDLPRQGAARMPAAEGLAAARRRDEEAEEMRSIVPSPDHRLTLVARGEGEGLVILEAGAWAIACAVGAGASMAQVLRTTGMAPLAAHRHVRAMLDSGVVAVGPPATAPAAAATPAGVVASPAPVPVAPAPPAPHAAAAPVPVLPAPAAPPVAAPELALTDRGPWPAAELAALVDEARADDPDEHRPDGADDAQPGSPVGRVERASLMRFFSSTRA